MRHDDALPDGAAPAAEAAAIGAPPADAGTQTPVATLFAQTLVNAIARISLDFCPQHVSNALWAFATMDAPLDKATERVLLEAAERTLPRANPQNIGNLLWALASLDVDPPRSLRRVVQLEVIRKAPNMVAQNVSNTLWAYATMGHQPIAVAVRALMAAAERTAPQMTAQNAANALWALAVLQADVPQPTLAALGAAIERTLSSGGANGQNVCNSLWALAWLSAARGVVLLQQGALFARAAALQATLLPRQCSQARHTCAALIRLGHVLQGAPVRRHMQIALIASGGLLLVPRLLWHGRGFRERFCKVTPQVCWAPAGAHRDPGARATSGHARARQPRGAVPARRPRERAVAESLGHGSQRVQSGAARRCGLHKACAGAGVRYLTSIFCNI
jgi:hypothetical protein